MKIMKKESAKAALCRRFRVVFFLAFAAASCGGGGGPGGDADADVAGEADGDAPAEPDARPDSPELGDPEAEEPSGCSEPAPPTNTPASGRPMTIPALREWSDGTGVFTLADCGRIVLDAEYADELEATGQIFADDLEAVTGMALPVVTGAAPGIADLYLSPGSTDAALGDEGYSLDISDRVAIRARTDAGVFYGTRTMLQLLGQGLTVAAGTARDWPSHTYRGLMVDNGRKYFTVGWLVRRVRELAFLKLNYFHLHVSDHQGFRLDSAVHPEIVSEQRYSREEIDAIQDAAEQNHVIIVPEIDMPGHMSTILAEHADLRVSGGDIDLGNEAAYTFMEEIVGEFLPWFRGPYWHMGADEYGSIDAPSIQAYAEAHYGSSDPRDTFLGFINWMDDLVTARGKTLRVWNDGIWGGTNVQARTDIVIDVWTGGGNCQPAQSLIDQGYTLMNGTGAFYYVLGVDWKPDSPTLYETWEPNILSSGTVAVDEPGNQGAKMHIWCDYPDAETEDEVGEGVRIPLRVIAQKTWGSPLPAETYDAFALIIDAVGDAPGGE
jgi:hexosaminidase